MNYIKTDGTTAANFTDATSCSWIENGGVLKGWGTGAPGALPSGYSVGIYEQIGARTPYACLKTTDGGNTWS